MSLQGSDLISPVVIYVPSYGYTYTFSGVLSLRHEFSLKINTDNESASGTDYLNGARNQPDRLVLSVMESDIGHPAGWADRMLQALESVKRARVLCQVTTPAFAYTDMLLTEFTATADETSQSGWQGNLTFTKYVPPALPAKTNDNASTPANTGSAGPARTVSNTAASGGTSPFRQMLERAGVYL